MTDNLPPLPPCAPEFKPRWPNDPGGYTADQMQAYARAAIAAQHVPQYDQQALELCEACGWKTLIPDEGCLNCERKAQSMQQDHYKELAALGWQAVECPVCGSSAQGYPRQAAQPQPVQEPVIYQFRWTNPDGQQVNDSAIEWTQVEPRWNGTVQEKCAELLAHRYDGKPCYEVRALYTSPQTEAQKHIDYLEHWNPGDPIAAELRRLEAANAELLESLVDLVALYPLDSTDAIITSARAAITKHGGAA